MGPKHRPSQTKGTSDSICCGCSDLLISIQLFFCFFFVFVFIILLLREFWLLLLFVGLITSMRSKGTHYREFNFSSQIICDQVKGLSLFCDHLCCTKWNLVRRTPSMPCIGSSKACSMGVASDRWSAKPTEEVTLSSVQRFDPSTGYDLLFLPVLYQLFTSYYQSIQFLEPVLLLGNYTVL